MLAATAHSCRLSAVVPSPIRRRSIGVPLRSARGERGGVRRFSPVGEGLVQDARSCSLVPFSSAMKCSGGSQSMCLAAKRRPVDGSGIGPRKIISGVGKKEKEILVGPLGCGR